MDGEVRELRSNSRVIIEGPSFEELVTSLTTHSENKVALRFVLDSGAVKACVYELRDSGNFEAAAKSQVYIVGLTAYPYSGRGHWPAVARYYVDTKTWGGWLFLREDC